MSDLDQAREIELLSNVPTGQPEPRNDIYPLDTDYAAVGWSDSGDRWPAKPEGEERYLSQEQIDRLATTLQDVPQLLEDLEIATTKDVRFPPTRTISGDGTEEPVMFNVSAAEASRHLTAAVKAAAALLWHSLVPSTRRPSWDVLEAAEWLYGQLNKLALDPEAERVGRNIIRRANRSRNVIDHPKEIRYLGDCPTCGADLEAEEGDDYVTCHEPKPGSTEDEPQECGWFADVSDVLAKALKLGDDLLFTDTELVGVLHQSDGRMIPRDHLKKWANRGRLASHERKRWWRGKLEIVRVYKLGDVRLLVEEMDRNKAKRRTPAA